VANYDPDYFMWEVPAIAQELGCNPDFNGWTNATNPRPEPLGKPMRTASGHVHIGWTDGQDVEDKDHFLYCSKIARQMDYYLGINSLRWDKDATRRQLYGKAGAFRPKPYGMEYRVLSNRWLDSDDLMAWVYNTIQVGMSDAEDGFFAEDRFENLAQHIIDNNLTDWQKTWPTLNLGLPEVPLLKVA
jgi:hypothetical protein